MKTYNIKTEVNGIIVYARTEAPNKLTAIIRSIIRFNVTNIMKAN